MSDTADVSITIDPVNDAPVAPDDTATMNEDAGATAIDVLGNDSDVDGDDLTIVAKTDGVSGVVAITGGGSGLTYRPNDRVPRHGHLHLHGLRRAPLADRDGLVTVTSVNDKPVADDDDFGVDEDGPATALAVLAGDTDVDGDTLTITAVTQGSKGAVVITGGGTGLTYRPFSNLSGTDTFTYTVSDGHGQTDTATVTMTIGGENDPPDAVNDLGLHVREGAGPTPLAVLTNDDDPDGNDLTIKSVTPAAHGTITITGNGTGLTLPAGEVVPRDRHVHLHRRRRPRIDRQGHRAGHRRQGCRRAGGGRAAPAVPEPDHRHGLGQGADLVVGVGSGLGGHPLHAPGERQRRHVPDGRAPAGDHGLASTRPSATAGRTGSGSGPSTTRATPAPSPTARRSGSGSTRSPMRRSRTPRAGARSGAHRPSVERRASR